MNNLECNEDFQIFYNNREVSVSLVCEGNDMYFIVNLPEGKLKVIHDIDEEGRDYWIQEPGGETDKANELGELIEYASLETLAL